MKVLVDALAARRGGGRWFTSALITKMAQKKSNWDFYVFCSKEDFIASSDLLPNLIINRMLSAKSFVKRVLIQQFYLRQRRNPDGYKSLSDENFDVAGNHS